MGTAARATHPATGDTITRGEAERIAATVLRGGILEEHPVGWLVRPRAATGSAEPVVGLGCHVVTRRGELYAIPSSVPWSHAPREVAVLLGLEGGAWERLAARLRSFTGNGGPVRIAPSSRRP